MCSVPFSRPESASGGADERVQVRAGAWAGASRGSGVSGVHGTPGRPCTARLLSAGAPGDEVPNSEPGRERRAGRGLRRITGRPGARLPRPCRVPRCRSSISHPGLWALPLGLQRRSAGDFNAGSVGVRPSSSAQGAIEVTCYFSPETELSVFVGRRAAMAAGKVSVGALHVPQPGPKRTWRISQNGSSAISSVFCMLRFQ